MHMDWKVEDNTLRMTFLSIQRNIAWYTFLDGRPMFYEILSNLLRSYYMERIINDSLHPPISDSWTIWYVTVATQIQKKKSSISL